MQGTVFAWYRLRQWTVHIIRGIEYNQQQTSGSGLAQPSTKDSNKPEKPVRRRVDRQTVGCGRCARATESPYSTVL